MNTILKVIAIYILLTSLLYADTIVWGFEECGYDVKGLLCGVIEYSDNVYGDTMQNALKTLNSWIMRDNLPNGDIVYAFCPFLQTSNLGCIYLEFSEFKG